MKTKTKAGLVWLLALSLFISVTASTVAVAGRIRYYTAVADVDSMIPLVPEYVTEDDLLAAAQAKAAQQTVTLSAAMNPLSANPPQRRVSPINVTYCAPTLQAAPTYFTVSDDNTVWNANTRVDIFKTTYENGQGNIVVASDNGDKVIAPGTENSYTFKLKNDYGLHFNYTVAVKAYVTPDNIEIPVTCRLSRYDGKWLAGSDTEWLSVPQFDGASDAARMGPRSYVAYTLDWQWPYEGDDAADTLLGNLATQEDLTLTIEIITTAESLPAGDPDDPIVPDPIVPDEPAPDTPPTPVDPDAPIVPDEPAPDTPPTPVDPDAPIVPDEPAPDTPPTPVDPNDPIVLPPEDLGVGQLLPPKTGDESHPVLWMTLAGVSFILLLILLFRKDEDENSTAEASS